MRAVSLFFVTAVVAFGQIDPDTITVVSRASAASAGPDTVSYSVSVYAPLGAGLEDVLKAVSGIGLTERELTDVSVSRGFNMVCTLGPNGCAPTVTWSFQFNSPLAKLSETLKGLNEKPPAGMNLYYSLNGGGVSAAPECAYPTLISGARRYAESLAAAAGVRVGKVTALSDAAAEPVGGTSAARFAFVAIPMTLTGFLLGPPPQVDSAPACAVTVQFQLLR